MIIRFLEAWLRRVWGIEANDEVSVNNALKAVQITWVFAIIFLFVWSLHEIYNMFKNYVVADWIPMILLGLQVFVFGLFHFILKNNSIPKKILASWIFGVILLSVCILYNISITPVLSIDIITTLLSLQLVIFIFSRFILEHKTKKDIIKEEQHPPIWQARNTRGIIFGIVLGVVLIYITIFHLLLR